MLKILGMMLVIGSCTFAGKRAAKSYAARPGQLGTLRQGLQYLETEITFSCMPLPFAFMEVAAKLSGVYQKIFQEIGEALQKKPELTPCQAWQHACSSKQEEIFLNKTDREILKAFMKGLGESSRNEQLKQMALVQELLRNESQKAEEEAKKLVKVYSTLGVSIGLALVVILS